MLPVSCGNVSFCIPFSCWIPTRKSGKLMDCNVFLIELSGFSSLGLVW